MTTSSIILIVAVLIPWVAWAIMLVRLQRSWAANNRLLLENRTLVATADLWRNAGQKSAERLDSMVRKQHALEAEIAELRNKMGEKHQRNALRLEVLRAQLEAEKERG
jgi:DNA anti-recombination protein RmuC